MIVMMYEHLKPFVRDAVELAKHLGELLFLDIVYMLIDVIYCSFVSCRFGPAVIGLKLLRSPNHQVSLCHCHVCVCMYVCVQ